MRLLQLDNDKGDEFTLVEFIGENVPPYAILSHTWGPNNSEVTYTDFVQGGGKSKPGYRKILLCGREAMRHRLGYIWVDTCCIDKTSSAELSEAINSMYRWYEQAAVCFAYLEDVSPDLPISEWLTANIKWFTRGWTLQELLASRNVEFYAADWTYLGTKAKYSAEISIITGIQVEALRRTPVRTFSIAQRMSWASKRTTTRSEDIAYCLLGLFDVNMPLLYGEGQRKAFVRLQGEIMKESDDHSLFAWCLPTADNHESQGRGLLAHSPAEFASSGTIVAVRDLRLSSPYSMTNAGLCITLPLAPITGMFAEKRQVHLGILNCTNSIDSATSTKQLVALWLYPEIDKGDQYERVVTNTLRYAARKARASSRKTIYVRKH